jgi:hypothetical protein
MSGRARGATLKSRFSPRFFVASLLGCLGAVLAFSQAAASVGLPIDAFRPLGAGFFSMRAVQAEASKEIVEGGPRSDPRNVAMVGQKGLFYAPLNTRALWLVGQSFDALGSTAKARAAMLQAERVSRRDAAVQLWLGTDGLKAGNSEQGLRHFDMMIRTNYRAAEFVTPELAKLVVYPDGRKKLAPYIRKDNAWLNSFLWAAAYQLPDAEPLAKLLIEDVKIVPDVTGARGIYGYLLQKLVRQGEYRLASALYPRLPGVDATDLGTLDALSAGQAYPPFTWEFPEASSQSGSIVNVGADRLGFEFYAAPGTAGIAASKLVALDGPTALKWQVLDAESNLQSGANWVATCLIGKSVGVKVRSSNFLSGERTKTSSLSMPLPVNCDLVRVDAEISGGIGRAQASVVVADIKIVSQLSTDK